MALGMEQGNTDLWVFGYGSLMWRPGFAYEEVIPARIFGYHRKPCIKSIRFRGTPEVPGVVVGLAPGGSCLGMAYRIAAGNRAETVSYLDQREMASGAYQAKMLNGLLQNGRKEKIYGFVATHPHPQYVGDYQEEDLIQLIYQGRGLEGRSLVYLQNTVAELAKLGIHDRGLNNLIDKVQDFEKRKGCPP